jgi:O-antigen/teichoic acid export membrane protein
MGHNNWGQVQRFINRYGHWGIRGGMSLLDQGVYSGANFVFSVLLARWLTGVDFGVFAIVFATYSIFYQLHTAYITDSMNVLGPANYKANIKAYIVGQLKVHFLVTISIGLLFSCILLGYNFLFTTRQIDIIWIYYFLCLPFMLLPWFVRRAFYLLGTPGMAATTSGLYGIILFVLLFVIKKNDYLNATTSLLPMALAGFLSGLLILWVFGTAENNKKINLDTIFKQNWVFGKWLIFAGVLVSLTGQIQIYMTGLMLSVEAAGALKAILNIIQPMIVMISSLSVFALPILARNFGLGEKSKLQRNALNISLISTLGAIIYFVTISLLRIPVENLLYNGKYSVYVFLIPILGIVPIFMAITTGVDIAFRAIQKPQSQLIVSIVWVTASALSSFVFIYYWGIMGAALSAVFGQSISTLVYVLLYKKWLANEKNDTAKVKMEAS